MLMKKCAHPEPKPWFSIGFTHEIGGLDGPSHLVMGVLFNMAGEKGLYKWPSCPKEAGATRVL